jgi:sulfatase maturation enzyme AslB (radical SAM superfamily)
MYNSNTPFMSKDIAQKAIKNLVNNNKIGNEININFFGGEPLMNFELYFARAKHVR